jgi:hypothetical protein
MSEPSTNTPDALNFDSSCMRLGHDGAAKTLNMDGTFWNRLGSGELGDFKSERLVMAGAFESDWDIGRCIQTARKSSAYCLAK